MLVIDRMLGRPLTCHEFCRLAGGDIDDPVRAQKITNAGIVRLQDILGPDAIVRDGATPHLNPALVSVDLLEAQALLREAIVAAGKGPLMWAVDRLMSALDLI